MNSCMAFFSFFFLHSEKEGGRPSRAKVIAREVEIDGGATDEGMEE